MPAASIERLADTFWEGFGRPAPPRDLEPHLARLTGLFVVPLPNPRRDDVRDWLRGAGVAVPFAGGDKEFIGFLVAYRSRAAIFVDSTLPPDLRRVVVAHEFAHYLAEYEAPRQRVVRRLGPSLLPVLDGDRPLAPSEEWAGMLAGVAIGVHTHGLQREYTPAGGPDLPPAEQAANDLALELLAPRRCVRADFPDAAPTPEGVQNVLESKYGLPAAWASGYAVTVATGLARPKSFGAMFGL